MFKNVYNIAKAELHLLFCSPVAWLLLVVFMVQAALNFTDNIAKFVWVQEMGMSNNALTLSFFPSSRGGLFPAMQNYLYFYIPLLTMGVVSRELSSGSIKLLYSSPITNFQIIFGKYLGIVFFGGLMIGVLFFMMLCGGCVIENFDWPMVLTGLLGIYFLLCAYAAIGIFMSSLTSYQIVAALGTLIVLSLLSMVGNWGQEIDFVRNVTYWLSINGRSGTFISGMICSEEVLYFITVIGLFLALTVIRLNAVRQKTRFTVTLGRNLVVIAITCLVAYFSSMPVLKVYYDATATKMNTLTKNSQEIVSKLDDKVTITTYVNVLSSEGANESRGHFMLRDMDRFKQYLRFKPDMKLKYVYYYDTCYNPGLDRRYPGKTLREKMVKISKLNSLDTNKFLTPEEIRARIDLSGEGNTFVRQIVRENGQKAWLRVYDDQQKYPSEQEISAALKRMVMKLPVVGFLRGHGERDYSHDKDRDYSSFANNIHFRYALMNQGFDVEYVTLDKPVRDDINIMVIAESRGLLTESENAILDQYIARGGNLFILGEPRRCEVMNPLLAKFGFELMEGQLVTADTNLQADVVVSHATKNIGSVAYAFREMYARRQVIASKSVTGLRQTGDTGYKVTEMFKTDTPGYWNELETTDFVDDTVRLNPAIGEVEQSYPTMVALSREVNGKEQRVILSGDADCISNGGLGGGHRGIRQPVRNFNIIMGGFFWLSDNEVPVDMRRPPFTDNRLYVGSTGAGIIKWILTLVLPLVLAIIAAISWIRRRRK